MLLLPTIRCQDHQVRTTLCLFTIRLPRDGRGDKAIPIYLIADSRHFEKGGYKEHLLFDRSGEGLPSNFNSSGGYEKIPFGLFEYSTIPFGLGNAIQTF